MGTSKNLLIVESPTKEKTLMAILGRDFTVKSSFGHIRDLPQRELGVDVNKGFAPKYVLIRGKGKVIEEMKASFGKSSKVYLATDFDREGEAIAWHIAEILKLPPERLCRITFHEITPRAITEALKNPRGLDFDLVNAQQARRIVDRLVGYMISPLLWRKIQRGLSAGRVQSVTLGFIVEREKEIEAFKPQEYWSLHAELKKTTLETPFLAALIKRGDQKIERLDLKSEAEVQEIILGLKDAEYLVSDIKKAKLTRSPQPPFTTASLQQASYRTFGFSPAKTMMLAQALYEGKKLPEGNAGLITYMRTDSIAIAREAEDEASRYVKERWGVTYLTPEPNKRFKAKQKFVQEAHEAIRPTSVFRDLEAIKACLTEDEAKLYALIWTRLLASQMADEIMDVTSVFIQAADCEFKATGNTIVFDGFKKVEAVTALVDTEDISEKFVLPQLAIGEKLLLTRLLPQQHFTEPPPRYNAASLVKALEVNGVGRPSTYAPTIATLINRHYVTLEKKVFKPTDLGRRVFEGVKKHFASIADVKFTASLEELLDDIAEGKAKWVDVLEDFWKAFEQDLKKAETEMTVQRQEPKKTEEICPKCSSAMMLRESRFGKFLSCSQFPKCRFKIGLTATGQKKSVILTSIACEKCGSPMVEREGRRGKFLACSKFPTCRFTKSVNVS